MKVFAIAALFATAVADISTGEGPGAPATNVVPRTAPVNLGSDDDKDKQIPVVTPVVTAPVVAPTAVGPAVVPAVEPVAAPVAVQPAVEPAVPVQPVTPLPAMTGQPFPVDYMGSPYAANYYAGYWAYGGDPYCGYYGGCMTTFDPYPGYPYGYPGFFPGWGAYPGWSPYSYGGYYPYAYGMGAYPYFGGYYPYTAGYFNYWGGYMPLANPEWQGAFPLAYGQPFGSAYNGPYWTQGYPYLYGPLPVNGRTMVLPGSVTPFPAVYYQAQTPHLKEFENQEINTLTADAPTKTR